MNEASADFSEHALTRLQVHVTVDEGQIWIGTLELGSIFFIQNAIPTGCLHQILCTLSLKAQIIDNHVFALPVFTEPL